MKKWLISPIITLGRHSFFCGKTIKFGYHVMIMPHLHYYSVMLNGKSFSIYKNANTDKWNFKIAENIWRKLNRVPPFDPDQTILTFYQYCRVE